MSTLTDLFTSLANKIRSKLGTSITYTPSEAISAIDDVYTKGVTDTKKGSATTSDVKNGVTFTSTNGVNLTGTFTAQTKSATPSTSAQTISPDSGKYLSSVSVSAISPQNTAGVAANTAGRDAGGAYVYFPYGWYPQYGAYGCFIRPTDAQAQAMHAHTGTYTFSSGNGSTIDLGLTHSYRYVNAQVIYANGKRSIGTNNQYCIVSPSSTGTTYFYSTQYGAGFANTFCFTILSNTAGSFVSGDVITIYDVNGTALRSYDLTKVSRMGSEYGLLSPNDAAEIYAAGITVQSKTVGFYFRWLFA